VERIKSRPWKERWKPFFSKINIGTRIKTVFTESIRETLRVRPDLKDQLQLLQLSAPKIKETVKEKIRLLGSENRC